MHIFFIYKFFSNSLRFKSSFKFTKSRNSVFQVFLNFRYCFRSSFWTVCRNEPCDTPLESYERGTTFICWNSFKIPYSFKLILKNRAADDEWQRPFFAKFLQTAGRNDSNDTALERYRWYATLWCRTLSNSLLFKSSFKFTEMRTLFFATPKST